MDHLSTAMLRVLGILSTRDAPVGPHTRDGYIAGCTVCALQRRGLVKIEGGRVVLTPQGRALAWAATQKAPARHSRGGG